MADRKVELGKKVPAFKMESTTGKIYRLSQDKGKRVVLFFYPKDNTPGCTTEGNDFKKSYKQFQKLNTEVYGISRDSISSHEKFIDKQGFPFALLSDPSEEVCELFDVLKMKNMYGRKFRGIERSTFVIDEKGKLIAEWRKVKVAGHVKEVLTTIKNMLIKP